MTKKITPQDPTTAELDQTANKAETERKLAATKADDRKLGRKSMKKNFR